MAYLLGPVPYNGLPPWPFPINPLPRCLYRPYYSPPMLSFLRPLGASALSLAFIFLYNFQFRATGHSFLLSYNLVAFSLLALLNIRQFRPRALVSHYMPAVLDFLFIYMALTHIKNSSALLTAMNLLYLHVPFVFFSGADSFKFPLAVLGFAPSFLLYSRYASTVSWNTDPNFLFFFAFIAFARMMRSFMKPYFPPPKIFCLFMFSLLTGLSDLSSLKNEFSLLAALPSLSVPQSWLPGAGLILYTLLMFILTSQVDLDLRLFLAYNISLFVFVLLLFVLPYESSIVIWIYPEYKLLIHMLLIQAFNTAQAGLAYAIYNTKEPESSDAPGDSADAQSGRGALSLFPVVDEDDEHESASSDTEESRSEDDSGVRGS